MIGHGKFVWQTYENIETKHLKKISY